MVGKLTSLPVLRSRLARIVGLAIAMVLLIFGGAQVAAGFEVPRGTVVGNTSIGGRSSTAAEAALATAFPATEPLRLRVDGRVYRFDAADVRVDPAATVRSAIADRWNPVRLVDLLLGNPRTPVVAYDDAQLTAALVEFAGETDVAPRNANIDMDTMQVTSVKSGRSLDVEAAKRAIVEAVAQGARTITLPRTDRPAVVSELVAERALREIAQPAIAEPVTVNVTLPDGTQRTSTIRPQTIRDALSFVANGALLEPKLDGDLLRQDVDTAVFDVQKPAVDATFTMNGDAVQIVPSRDGFGVTPQSLATDVLKVIRRSGTERVVQLALGSIAPRFSTADAEALNIRDRVSWYRQRFPAATYRTINIGTAAKRINGTLLQPGEVFSMNDTVKERTEANGYTEGWIIGPDGIFKKDLGGAVSTITTAVFNAAWFAGVELVEHRAHSIYMSRYRPGREATVLWGSFDMKFKNTLANPIYITTDLQRTSITVTFWGTKEFSKVDSLFGPRENQRPYPKLTGLLPDCEPQDGMQGFQITVWRLLYRNDVEVAREPYRTRYRPAPQIVCKRPPKPTPPEPPVTDQVVEPDTTVP